MVPNKQDYKFFVVEWWQLPKEPQDSVMCAHIFGGASASCSNYALWETAFKNELIFGKATLETL